MQDLGDQHSANEAHQATEDPQHHQDRVPDGVPTIVARTINKVVAGTKQFWCFHCCKFRSTFGFGAAVRKT